jgi:hypothetical protein
MEQEFKKQAKYANSVLDASWQILYATDSLCYQIRPRNRPEHVEFACLGNHRAYF